MEDYRRFDDIVTEFLLNTTRLRPRLTEHAVLATICCGIAATKHPPDDEEADFIPLTTGSVAEFCIEPMHECFGDVDVMYHFNTTLAIPQGHSPPTQLPDEFHNYVRVDEIIDSQFPGYVYLELRYLLTQCSDDDTYNAVEYDRGMYLENATFRSSDSRLTLMGWSPASRTDQRYKYRIKARFPWTVYHACVVCCGRRKPLIGQHDTETTNGQSRQLLIVLSATDVIWFP